MANKRLSDSELQQANASFFTCMFKIIGCVTGIQYGFSRSLADALNNAPLRREQQCVFLIILTNRREGSVHVDIEMTFNREVGQSEVESALGVATENRNLGRFEIRNVGNVTAPTPTATPTGSGKSSLFLGRS